MAAETQYTANTGVVKMITGNSSMIGTTGTVYDVITGASNGTLVRKIFIKATGTGAASTTLGMIRLFVYDGTNHRLLTEIEVPAMGQSATDPTFETVLELNYKLKSGYKIRATTQNGEAFNVIAEGLDFAYYATSVRPESTNYTANNSFDGTSLPSYVAVGNSALDGSTSVANDLITVLAASTATGMKGNAIESISIKATSTTSRGMVRIFIQNASTGTANTFLLTEIFIPPITPGATVQSFEHKIVFPDKLQIKAGFKIIATTQNSESFSVVVEGMDWSYPA